MLHKKGRGVPQSHREAVRLFQRAIESRDANSYCNLGIMYEDGTGVRTVRALRLAGHS